MTLYNILWFFMIYSFVGWIVEVVYHAVTLGKVINRGFLNGPVCPVYGFGVLSVFAVVNLLQTDGHELNGVWIFVFGITLATAIELLAGWALDVIFHARWWDYSDKPFNFRGYICLEFSIIWGLCIVFIIRVFHSFVDDIMKIGPPEKYGWIILAVLYIAFLSDVIVTVAMIIGLNKKLKQLDILSSDMRKISDSLSSKVGEGTIEAAKKVETGKAQVALARVELREAAEQRHENRYGTTEELKQKLSVLQNKIDDISVSVTKNHIFGTGHILRAFPHMQHRKYQNLVSALQQKIQDKK